MLNSNPIQALADSTSDYISDIAVLEATETETEVTVEVDYTLGRHIYRVRKDFIEEGYLPEDVKITFNSRKKLAYFVFKSDKDSFEIMNLFSKIARKLIDWEVVESLDTTFVTKKISSRAVEKTTGIDDYSGYSSSKSKRLPESYSRDSFLNKELGYDYRYFDRLSVEVDVPVNPIFRYKIGENGLLSTLPECVFVSQSYEYIPAKVFKAEDGYFYIVPFQNRLKANTRYKLLISANHKKTAGLIQPFVTVMKDFTVPVDKLEESDNSDVYKSLENFRKSLLYPELLESDDFKFFIKDTSADYNNLSSRTLYKMKKNYSSQVSLRLDYVQDLLFIKDDSIFVTRKKPLDSYQSLYKTNFNGLNTLKMAEGANFNYLAHDADFIYYSIADKNSSNSLFKVNYEGTETTPISALPTGLKKSSDKPSSSYAKKLDELDNKIKKELSLFNTNSIKSSSKSSIFKNLEPVNNVMSFDDKYIYYHTGNIFTSSDSNMTYVYQDKPCNVYRRDIKTGKNSLMIKNITFANPLFKVYTNPNQLVSDVRKLKESKIISSKSYTDLNHLEEDLLQIFLKNTESGIKYISVFKISNNEVSDFALKSLVRDYISEIDSSVEPSKKNLEYSYSTSVYYRKKYNREEKSYYLTPYTTVYVTHQWVNTPEDMSKFTFNSTEKVDVSFDLFKDEHLRKHLEKFVLLNFHKLGKGLTTEQIESITEIDFTGDEITDLSGIELLTNLRSLNLSKNDITDLSPLNALQNLEYLNLDGNTKISDLSPLKSLKNLKGLLIKSSELTSIKSLSELKNLETLIIQGASFERPRFSNITPLENLVNLKYLDLSGNKISDLSPLSKLNKLEYLNLSSNRITDISSLESLVALEKLYLSKNEIRDLEELENLSKLNTLHINNNKIRWVKYLSELKNLKYLKLKYNDIKDIETLESIYKNLYYPDFKID